MNDEQAPLRKPDMALDLSAMERDQQFRMWQQISGSIGDVLFNEDTHNDDTAFTSVAWNLSQLVLTTTSFPMSTVIRNDEHIAKGNSDYVRIRIFRGGGGTSVVDNKSVTVVPDDVHFVHGSSRVHLTARADDILGLLIPYDLIDFDSSKVDRYFSVPAAEPTSRMIRAALETTLLEMPRTEIGHIPRLASALIGLIRGLLVHEAGEMTDDTSFRLLQQHAVRQFVDQNLLDTEITAERLSTEFNASRSTIYRHFSDLGGLRKYILNRRLDRSMFDLVTAEKTRGAVTQIAGKWGFTDTALFSRQFRERFGTPPVDALGLKVVTEPQQDVEDSTEVAGLPEFAFLLEGSEDPVKYLNNLQET
ncbi:MAG: helix-turn-helix domain-containing protein [Pseudomonadota bacterium]